MSQISNALAITRIANACILMEIGNDKILTDPFFWNPSYLGIKEEIAIKPEELPRLTAIVGCHGVIDHWQIQTLSSYPYRHEVPVFVSTKSMANKARSAGFSNVEVVEWGEHRSITKHLQLEVVKAHSVIGLTVNNYVLRKQGMSVFFGSEARDLAPLREYRLNNKPVDVVVAPPNAVHLLGIKLVMSGKDAVEATKILGSKLFFSIHDAHPEIPLFISVRSSGDEAEAAASLDSDIEVIRIPTGQKWEANLANR